MAEEWKVIENYENYSVSTFGNIYSKKSKKNIKGSNKSRYISVTFFNVTELKKVSIAIHKLVAQAFIPNPDNRPYVDHINGDKHNNLVTNLRWVTNSENLLNPITNEQRSKTNNQGTKIQYIDKLNTITIYNSLDEAEKGLKISRYQITKILNNQFTTENDNPFRMIYIYDKNNNFLEKYKTQREIATKYNIGDRTILQICKKNYTISKHTNKIIQDFVENYILEYVNDLPNIREIANEYEDEIWKIIINEPTHKISNYGRILNIERNKYLDGCIQDGYNRCIINKTAYTLHRLVAQHFLDSSTNIDDIVIHIDKNNLNNKATNLKWTTLQQNVQGCKGTKPVLDNKKHCGRCLTYKPFDQFYSDISKENNLSSNCKECMLAKVQCECGKNVAKISLNKHMLTQKHLDIMKDNK